VFTPEGYWSWTDMCSAVVEWSREIAIAQRLPSMAQELTAMSGWDAENALYQKLIEDGFVDNRHEAQFALDVSALWLLANFLDTYETLLCSPSGTVMRCPPMLAAHGDAFEWWSWPLDQQKFGKSESSSYLDFFRHGKFRILDAQARFCAIDHLSGIIKLKPNSIDLFSRSSYGHGPEKNEIQLFIDQQVRPFVGWSICWSPDDIPETQREVFGSLGIQNIDWERIEDHSFDKSKASQNSASNVIDCVIAAFPDGKGDVTWPDVEAKVGYSRRSILRALKQNGLHSKWAKPGQEQ
jgi:hypothetical protein